MDESPQNDPIVIVKSNIKKPSFFKRVRSPFSSFSSPNKKIASAILTMLLVFGVGVGVYVAQRPTQLRPQAVAGGIDINLLPSTIQTTQNEQFTVDVSVNAKTQQVTAVEFSIDYDPAKVQFVSGATGTFLPNLLGSTGTDGGFHQSAGKIKFTKITDPESTTEGTGTGTAAKLTFKSLQNSGSTQITLNIQETQAAVAGQSDSWIENLTNSTVNFASSASPSPSQTTSATSLKISAPDESQNVGTQFTVALKGRSDTEKSNLFQSNITFPTSLLEVISIEEPESKIEGSIIVEDFYDNTTGEISLVVGIPNGYQTTNSDRDLAIITFKAKNSGTANINLTGESKIFSNATNNDIIQNVYGDLVTLTGGSTLSCPPRPVPTCLPGGFTNTYPDPDFPGCSIAVCVNPSTSPSPSPSASTNCAALKGDGNGDCRVNLQDLSILLTHFSASNPVPGGKEKLDFNDDGRINSFDFSSMGTKLFQLGVIRRRS